MARVVPMKELSPLLLSPEANQKYSIAVEGNSAKSQSGRIERSYTTRSSRWKESESDDEIRANIQQFIRENRKNKTGANRSQALNLLTLKDSFKSYKPSRTFAETNLLNALAGEDNENLEPGVYKLGKHIPWGIINPDGKFMSAWTVILLIALLYTATVMPYFVAFSENLPENWFMVELVFDLVFIIDFFLNFNIAYWEKEELIVDRKKIFKKYLKSWFFADISASFPFSILTMILENEL
jgi:hypothetical protein